MSFDARARTRALLALVVCTALFVTACGNDDSGDEGCAASTDGGKEVFDQPFLLSSSFCIYFLPIQLAYHQGFFDDVRLNPKIQVSDGSSLVTAQCTAGYAVCGVAGARSDNNAHDKCPNVRAISCIRSQSSFSFYVPADSDIQDVTHLDGKKLGINERGGGEEQ